MKALEVLVEIVTLYFWSVDIPGGCQQEQLRQGVMVRASGNSSLMTTSIFGWQGLSLSLITVNVHKTVGYSEKQVQGWLV